MPEAIRVAFWAAPASKVRMADYPPNDLRITRYFEEILGSKLTNTQWSWGAESKTSRTLFFRVWKDHITDDKKWVQVSWESGDDKLGGRERKRHLDMMRSGRPTFGVICEAKDTTPGIERKIKHFDKQEFLRIGLPIQEDGKVLWATVEETLTFDKMMRASGNEAAIKDDVMEINEQDIAETTKQLLVDARLGQGKFRRELLALWGGRCAVTGSTTSEALRASHILPWSLSNDKERLDANNGLPLNASIDALFDSFVITFDDEGAMVVSKSIPACERELLGLDGRKLSKPFSSETKGYLARHRKLFDDKESKRATVTEV